MNRLAFVAVAALVLVSCSPEATAPGAVVASVAIEPPYLALVPDSSVRLTAVLRDSSGTVLQGRGVAWTTPDTAYIRVSASGEVTARPLPAWLSWNAVRIQASVEGHSAVAWATLVRRISRLGVIPDTITLYTGQSTGVSAAVFDTAGNAAFAGGATWSSLDTTRATVDSLGAVRALRVGVATIVTHAVGLSGSGTVRVIAPVVHVAISPATPTLLVGQSLQFVATVTDSAGNVLADRPVTWSEPGRRIALITAEGQVTAIATGTTPIVATVEGVSDTATLTATTDGAFVTVTAGDVHTCAVTTAGTTYCWGNGWYGQLGTNAGWSDYFTSPTRVVGGVTFQTLTARANHTCGLDAAGVAYCWGADDFHALGNASADVSCTYGVPCRGTPLPVSDTAHYLSLSAGGYHTCGITKGGVATCWGGNVLGQLGIGSADGSAYDPTPVAGGIAFATLEAGFEHTCGLASDSTTYCWGADLSQPVINTSWATSPKAVAGPAFVELATGYYHLCGLTAGGTAYCWGEDYAAAPAPLAGGGSYTHLTAGRRFTCGLDANGSAYCWGENSWGQLGNGTTVSSATPVPVSGGLHFTVLAAGGYHVCGLATTGRLYCWGDNYNGEIGDGAIGLLDLVPTLVLGQP